MKSKVTCAGFQLIEGKEKKNEKDKPLRLSNKNVGKHTHTQRGKVRGRQTSGKGWKLGR